MAKKSVLPGNPPLIWSNVEKAFANINSNFDELYLTIGGGSVVDLTTLESSIIPGSTNIYSLGTTSKAFTSIHASEYEAEGPGEFNGLYAGAAQIKGIGSTIDLPLNSTVDGELIIDPNKTFFKSFQIDDGNRIVADEFVDTVNFLSGTAIQITTDSGAESITFTNTGVTALAGGSGISVSSATGNITVTNTGVLSITNSTNLSAQAPYSVGALGRSAGTGIRVDTATGNPVLTNIGVIEVQGGFGITTNTDPVTGIATIQNNAPAQPAFGRIRLAGDGFGINDVVAEVTTDQLVIDQGYGIVVTTTPLTDTIKLEVDQRIDIIGSVFSDGSTMLVDGTNGVIPAENLLGTASININGDTIGYHTGDVEGSVFADDSTLLVDAVDGKIVGNVETTSVSADTVATNGLTVNAQARLGEHWPFTDGTDDIGRVGNRYGNIYANSLIGNVVGNVTGDLIGSVFADDSTLLVNGVDGSLTYSASVPSDWDGTAPTTVGEAIDRLATLVKTLNAGTGA